MRFLAYFMKRKVRILALVTVYVLSFNTSYAQQKNPFFCAQVMSYNILNIVYESENDPWEVRKKFVFDVIQETTPDLIGFQEDNVIQAQDLEARFPDYLVVKAPISIRSGENAYHSIFFNPTKFELIENGSFTENNRARRNANWAKLKETRSGVQIFVINGHFLVPDPIQVRIDAAVRYATEIALLNTENAPIIMLGDLNANLTSVPVQYLTSDLGTFPSLDYSDNFRKLFTPAEWRRNTSFGDQSIPIDDSIDFILTSEELSFSNAQQISRAGFIGDDFFFGSDHNAATQRVCFGSAAPLLTPLIQFILNSEIGLNNETENDSEQE